MAERKSMVEQEPTKTFFSIVDLTHRWGLSKSFAYSLIKSGSLRSSHLGSRHIITVNQVAEFEASLDGGDREILTSQG